MEGPVGSMRDAGGSLAGARAVLCLWLAATASGLSVARGQATVHHDGFDSAEPSWRIEPGQCGATVLFQRRNAAEFHAGTSAEQIAFSTTQLEPVLRLSHKVPASLVFDELTAALWFRSNRAGARWGLRLRFPYQTDPRTGAPLSVDLLGDRYTTAGNWQLLTCRTTAAAVNEQLARIRNQLRGRPEAVHLETREMYVDAVVVHLELESGTTEVSLDELDYGPLVAPPRRTIEQTGWEDDAAPARGRLVIGDDRLLLDGEPFILRSAAYRGEPLDAFVECGVNTVWIEQYDDTLLLQALKEAGLHAMAAPPTVDDPGDSNRVAGLVPFTDDTSQILLWNMGTRLGPGAVRQVEAQAERVREADFRLSRPVLADVTDNELDFHRIVDVLGSSRHILHTSTSFRDYAAYLRTKRRFSLPDKPIFTHIQTEPSAANLTSRAEGQAVPVIEPEQYWMQGYAALSAGYKGFNYWTYSPLTSTADGGDERRLALSIFNSHVALLERWLATAKVVEVVPGVLGNPAAAAKDSPKGLGPLGRLLPGARKGEDHVPVGQSEIQVAVMQCEQGLLLLPVWYEDGAQFQPGPMTAEELTFDISLAGDYVRAWVVTTTDVSPLPQPVERVAGGNRIRVRNFDQFDVILLTRDDAAIQPLKQKVDTIRAASARQWIELAAAKVARVRDVHGLLSAERPIRGADAVLAEAGRLVEYGDTALERHQFDEARRAARKALQLTRTVQRRHWENAVANLTSGVSSPHTICFQTLPDHWRMVRSIGARGEAGHNLLRSGDFEDRDTFFAEGWRHEQGSDPNVRPWAELHAGAAQGRYCLHLSAMPADPSRRIEELSETPERFVSPPMPVYAGQIIIITGQVQVNGPMAGNSDGLVISESIKGTAGGLRWNRPRPEGGWQSFQLIREVDKSGELRLTIELRALGDVRIDDIKVVALNAR